MWVISLNLTEKGMKRMKTKAIALVAIIVALIGFALGFFGAVEMKADETQKAKNSKDLLIGCFITTEYLDLFDVEEYLEDNISVVMNSNNIMADMAEYENRIYAKLVDKSYTNEETGEEITTAEYVFEDLEGYSFYDCYIKAEGDSEGYRTLIQNGGICDIHVSNDFGDSYENMTLKGTIYTLQSDVMFYYSPVYQSEDGSVYLVSGTGSNVSGDSMSHSMKDEVTLTTDGETITKKNEVIISVEKADDIKEIELTELDKNNLIIKKENFTPKTLPEKYKPQKNTESIIITQTSVASQDNVIVSRNIVNKGEENFEVLTGYDEIVCEKKDVEMIWQKSSQGVK